MAKIDQMIKGPWLTTRNCVVGCPCQFNALPSRGRCGAAVEPIRNPVAGAAHRVPPDVPEGFEYTQAEIARGTARTCKHAAIALDWRGAHAHFTKIHLTRQGVVR